MCSKDGHGKYHLWGCDHKMRVILLLSIPEGQEYLENCGGYIP